MNGKTIARIKGFRSTWNIKENIWRGHKKKVAARQATIQFYAIREQIVSTQKKAYILAVICTRMAGICITPI